jgi:glycosyltransferase involved in cell wall biosynthesis
MERLNGTLARHDPTGEVVRYAGVVPHNEMHLRYKQADLALFASSCETFGQIVTEAMSAGLPIACSNRSAMPELLGDAGVYFDPENPEDIANAVKRLIDSPELRAEKAWAAFERVQQYSWPRCADETFSFLRDAARKSPIH